MDRPWNPVIFFKSDGTFLKRCWFADPECTILDREDGPAVERADGGRQWIIKNKYHRVDGPAIESHSGFQAWYYNDQRHREDGPARIWPNSNNPSEYWLYGHAIKPEDFTAETILKMKMINIIET